MARIRYDQWKTEPLIELPHISVVIPCFNEQERILPTIGAIIACFCALGRPWELIISDDGSTDQTVAIIEELHFANLSILRTPTNRGKGHAVQQGILAARGDFILFADADNSTPIEQIHQLLPLLETGAFDLAIGSRATTTADTQHRSLTRRMMSATLRAIVHHGLQLDIHDSQCGFKVFHQSVAKHLAQLQTMPGFAFDLELLFLAKKYHYQTIEIAVEWIDAPGSKVHPIRDTYRFIRDIMTIQFNNLRGRYAKPQLKARDCDHLSTKHGYT